MRPDAWLGPAPLPHGVHLVTESDEQCQGKWDGMLREEEQLWSLIQAGGHIRILGAGEATEIAFPNTAW
eukprot:12936262-Prorocentrum_lima.AAC.1